MKRIAIFWKRYHTLIRQLVLTEFKLRYQGSVLGYLWSLLKPLLFFAVLYTVFTRVLPVGKSVENFPAYLLLGIVIWTYFVEATTNGMHAIVGRGDLVRKVQISKVAIVISANSSALVNFGLNLCVAVCIALLSGTDIQIGLLWALPLLILELVLLTLGLGFLLSTLFVKYRDFSHIWEVVLQILFYATPIIYSLKNPGETIAKLISINPLAQIIQDVRRILVTATEPTTNSLLPFGRLIGVTIVLVVFGLGLYVFQSRKDYFAEEL